MNLRLETICSIPMIFTLALGVGGCMGGDFSSDYGGYDGHQDYDEDPSGVGDDGGQPVPPPSDSGELPEQDQEDASPEEPELCNASERVTLFLSPDDSNSMSSPVQAREAVLSSFGHLRDVPIRTWEFMNYYSFDYPAAEAGGIRVIPSLMRKRGDDVGTYTMQIAVASEQIAPPDRAPMNITLVLDTSGSMGGHAMDMLKASSRAIASNLDEGDIISMVEWDTENAIVLGGHAVQGPDDPTLLDAIEDLEPGGGTDLHGGLTAGYELALASYDPARINRIVLISDGGANAGITDLETIAMHAGDNNSDGVYMVGVGVGNAGTYNDRLMDQVTDAGKGASVFINDEIEAQHIFGTEFINTLDVAVRDVSVQLQLPPGFEVVRFSGEEISTDPTEVEPQHLAPNDAMIFHQQLETCAPELVDDNTTFAVTVRYLDGTTFEQGEVRVETSFGQLLGAQDAMLLKGAAIFEYAEGLKAHQQGVADPLAPAFEALAEAEAQNPGDPDLAEIRMVLEALS